MSYPSQPSYTPPYGQPQPPRQTNPWIVGGAIVVVLAIIMAVTLLIVQRTTEANSPAGGGPTTSDETTPEDEATNEDEPSEEETTESDGDGGEYAGDPADFTESTCDAFDPSTLEEVFDEAYDPDEDYISSTSSGDTGSLTCGFYTDSYEGVSVHISSYTDADSTMEYLESDREYWDDEEDYTVTDYTEFGDAGYHSIFGDDVSQKRQINVVAGRLRINVDSWIYPDQHDVDAVDTMLTEFGQQAATLFADYN